MEGQNTAKATGKEEVCKSKDKQQAVNGFGGSDHKNHHAGAAPAQIGMKTEAAKFPVFCYNSLERGTLQSTVGRVVRNSPVAKAV